MNTWEQFGELQNLCDLSIIGAYKDENCWDTAYQCMMSIIYDNRKTNPNYGLTLANLEEETEDEYGFYFFLDEYLDIIELRDQLDEFHQVADELIEVFKNDKYFVADMRFRKSGVFSIQGKHQEAIDYCKQWVAENENDIKPNTALVYALCAMKAYDEASAIVQKFIPDLTDCNESNENMFYAAQSLYKAMKKRKELKLINQAINDYEDYLNQQIEEEFDLIDDEDDDLWFYE